MVSPDSECSLCESCLKEADSDRCLAVYSEGDTTTKCKCKNCSKATANTGEGKDEGECFSEKEAEREMLNCCEDCAKDEDNKDEEEHTDVVNGISAVTICCSHGSSDQDETVENANKSGVAAPVVDGSDIDARWAEPVVLAPPRNRDSYIVVYSGDTESDEDEERRQRMRRMIAEMQAAEDQGMVSDTLSRLEWFAGLPKDV